MVPCDISRCIYQEHSGVFFSFFLQDTQLLSVAPFFSTEFSYVVHDFAIYPYERRTKSLGRCGTLWFPVRQHTLCVVLRSGRADADATRIHFGVAYIHVKSCAKTRCTVCVAKATPDKKMSTIPRSYMNWGFRK